MKRNWILSVILIVAICLSFSGCSAADTLWRYFKSEATETPYVSLEDELYTEAINSFFAAVDARDKDSVRALFSPYIQKTDKDLDEQIDLLFQIYADPTDVIGEDGARAGSYQNDHGTRSAEIKNMFPVISGGEYYWCSLDLRYIDEFDKEKVGISSLTLFSAEYYCAIRYDERKAVWPEGPGLDVLAEYPLDAEVRAIDGSPYKFTPIERTITEEQVAAFLETTASYSEFKVEFGEPNAINSYEFYALPDVDGEKRYLRLIIVEETDSIYSADVCTHLDWDHQIWNKA